MVEGEMVDGVTDCMDVGSSRLQESEGWEPGSVQSVGPRRAAHD